MDKMNKNKSLYSQKDYIQSRYDYDPELGILISKRLLSNGDIRRTPVYGASQKGGYRTLRINRVTYLYHRAIYLHQTGELPRCVDHIDRDRANNRIENLRPSDHSQNAANRIAWRSGCFKGVSRPACGKYQARIGFNGKLIPLGTYATEEGAARAYDDMAKELFGEYANLNFPE